MGVKWQMTEFSMNFWVPLLWLYSSTQHPGLFHVERLTLASRRNRTNCLSSPDLMVKKPTTKQKKTPNQTPKPPNPAFLNQTQEGRARKKWLFMGSVPSSISVSSVFCSCPSPAVMLAGQNPCFQTACRVTLCCKDGVQTLWTLLSLVSIHCLSFPLNLPLQHQGETALSVQWLINKCGLQAMFFSSPKIPWWWFGRPGNAWRRVFEGVVNPQELWAASHGKNCLWGALLDGQILILTIRSLWMASRTAWKEGHCSEEQLLLIDCMGLESTLTDYLVQHLCSQQGHL